jgi:hypothetical protein
LSHLAVDCFSYQNRLGRLRIDILGFVIIPMGFMRRSLDFKALAILTAASTLSRPRF